MAFLLLCPDLKRKMAIFVLNLGLNNSFVETYAYQVFLGDIDFFVNPSWYY